MRKFLPVALAAALFIGGTASMEASNHEKALKGSNVSIEQFKMNPARHKAEVMKNFKANAAQRAKTTVARADAADEIITEATGVVKEYTLSSMNYTVFYGYVFDYDDAGLATSMVFDEENHEVYIKNPISTVLTETYVKGTYDENKITINFPQAIYEYEGDVYYAHRMVADTENKGEYVVEDSDALTMTIAEDGTISADWNDGDEIIGLGYDGEWTGYGTYASVYVPFDGKMITAADMPEEFSAKSEKWALIADDSSANVTVTEYDGKVYVSGICDSNPDALVVGEINGDEVTFAKGQYLGVDEDYGYRLFFNALDVNDEEYEYSGYYSCVPYDTDIVFSYDAAAGVLEAKDNYIGVVGGDLVSESGTYDFGIYANAVIKRLPEEYSKVPANPYNLEFETYDGYDEALFYFSLDARTVDGWPLDTDNLYYRIYDNGSLFTFSPDVYYDMDTPTTDLGFSDDYYDADGYLDISTGYYYDRYVYFYSLPVNPGVQLVYKEGDTEYCSEVVYFEESGVAAAVADKEVESTTYVDINGYVVVNPVEGGFYLKTVKYTDGTKSTVKVLVK
jgi:hypothetical protein